MKLSERYISEGAHPRVITDGYIFIFYLLLSFEIGKQKALEFLESYKTKEIPTKEQLYQVALTSLNTKVLLNILSFSFSFNPNLLIN